MTYKEIAQKLFKMYVLNESRISDDEIARIEEFLLFDDNTEEEFMLDEAGCDWCGMIVPGYCLEYVNDDGKKTYICRSCFDTREAADEEGEDYLMCSWCGWEGSNDEISYDDHYSEYVCNWCTNGGRR